MKAIDIAGRVVYTMLGAAIASLVWTHSNAATFRGDEAACQSLGMFMAGVVELREAGVPRDAVDDHLNNVIRDSRASPDPRYYVKDDDDEAFVRAWVQRVWIGKVTPEEAGNKVYAECMRKPKSV